jgi:poly [ADP-ribose] polymerase 10/14/15
VGQLVQYSQKRPDGWAFGCIIYDEVEDRPGIDVQGVSSSSGWFPVRCTEMPSTKQLEKLQSVMGGEGAKALQAPEYWDQVKDPLVAQRFPLPPGPEKENVINRFKATLAPSAQVISVDRVQNMTLWQSYAVKRQTLLTHVDTKTGPGASVADQLKMVERAWLFHGTTEEIVPKILQQGFNRSFCGRNATMYGKGVYFARDASYSAHRNYSLPDASGTQRMFLCRVAVGDYCRGVKDALTPAIKDAAKHTLYDTTVDNEKDPSIFVTYHDASAYPEYLVMFKQ